MPLALPPQAANRAADVCMSLLEMHVPLRLLVDLAAPPGELGELLGVEMQQDLRVAV